MPVQCPLCSSRKAKRACPALERQICPVCCGTKRLTEIRCPPDCVYLATSKAHPPAVVQRRQERDIGFLFRFVDDVTEDQQRLLLLFLSTTVRHAASALPALNDADVAEAATVVASTLETARKGIIYQHQATSMPAQRLAAEFETQMARLTEGVDSIAGRLERDSAIVLRRIADAVAAGPQAFGDQEQPVFLNLARRIIGDMARRTEEDRTESGDSAPRLVIPG